MPTSKANLFIVGQQHFTEEGEPFIGSEAELDMICHVVTTMFTYEGRPLNFLNVFDWNELNYPPDFPEQEFVFFSQGV